MRKKLAVLIVTLLMVVAGKVRGKIGSYHSELNCKAEFVNEYFQSAHCMWTANREEQHPLTKESVGTSATALHTCSQKNWNPNPESCPRFALQLPNTRSNLLILDHIL